LADNYKRTKEWLNLAFSNIERVIRNYKEKDYSICVYLVQLSVEQVQKAIIFLLGLQFRKTHEPSKILESIEFNENIQIGKETLEKIKKIALLAKDIELEGTDTRYGKIINNKLITPEDKYDKKETEKYLNDLENILSILKDLLNKISDFVDESTVLSNLLKTIMDMIPK